MHRNKLNKRCEWPLEGKPQTTEERNQRRLQKMEWSPMTDKNHHSENDYPIKSNLHVQCNSHQNTNEIHHRDWKINPKVHLEAQKATNSQGNAKQKEQHWRYYNTRLQIILQNHSNKNRMILAQKQI
jgi:hypothetical protein